MARQLSAILEDKLAEDILLLDLRGISDFTDFFVIASGTSDRMLRSLSEAADEQIKAASGLSPLIEGKPESGWMVLDYGSVVAHIMSTETREYYELEELWKKGKVVLHLQ